MTKHQRITIVVPSFNQAKYLEETLRSVLEQNYPLLELIVIDGGSTDESTKIIEKYSRHLAYWISEKDGGQADAINKGLARTSGEIWAFLNSDDLLCPGSLARVAAEMEDPDTHWLGAVSDIFDEDGTRGQVAPRVPTNRKEYLTPWNRESQYVFPCSNVSFMRRELLDRIGVFDASYHFGMDIEFYCRAVFMAGIEPKLIGDVLGRWRWHAQSKTMRTGLWYGFRHDEIRIAEKYVDELDSTLRLRLSAELVRERKALEVRKASYYRHQGRLLSAFGQLASAAVRSPSIICYTPWLGTLARVCLFRRGHMARDSGDLAGASE